MGDNDANNNNNTNNDQWCIDLEGLCLHKDAGVGESTEEQNTVQQGSPSSSSPKKGAAAYGLPFGLFSSTVNNNKDEDEAAVEGAADKQDNATVYSDGSGTDRNTRSIQANVFMISGCEDSQTSADVSNVEGFSLPDPNGQSGGACTSALLKVLYGTNGANTGLTFIQVLNKMRTILDSSGYSQIPQLTSSQKMDVNEQFYIVPPDCQGTRRAVLIGINYTGQSGELSGCQNDCLNMKDYIMNVWGFSEENITVLMDDGNHTSPTRDNILQAYQNLAAVTGSGDAAFCHYSGHGGRVRDYNGEEADGYDETLVPLDYNSAGQIRDDDLYTSLVSPMTSGATLVSLMDCCHSGTVLDLPYTYKADGSIDATQSSFASNLVSGKKCGMALIIMIIIILATVLSVKLT